MNKPIAIEWLKKVYHDLRSAQILYESNHYTDCIGVDLHYAIEKAFKTFLAYENKKIPKTHNLLQLYNLVNNFITLEDNEIDILHIANTYHIEESYPTPNRHLPPRDEIQRVLDFTEKLLDRVCNILDINKQQLI